MRTRHLALVLAALAILSGCTATLVTFVAPTMAPAGRVFAVTVTGSWTGIDGRCGCVMQLPNGFTIESWAHDWYSVVTPNDPTVLGAYTAEPGHYLASWSGGGSHSQASGTNRLIVWLRAPAAATTAALKVSLGGSGAGAPFVPTSPANVASFAQITASPHAQSIAITSQPSTAFAREDLTWSPNGQASWYGATFADIDRDGDDDLAAWSTSTGIQVWRPGAASTWSQASPPSPFSSPNRCGVACGDFDGDSFVDVVEGAGRVFYGNGAGGWTAGPVLTVLGGGSGVAAGDVNGDGRDDVAIGSRTAGQLRVWLGNGNRTFTLSSLGLPVQSTGAIDGGRQLLLRDVTGDGNLDLVWTRATVANVWAGDGFGNWSAGGGIDGPIFHGAAAGDLDGNGTLELVFGVRDDGSGFGGGVAVYEHVGGNVWSPVPTSGLPTTGVGMGTAVLDYDRDGDLDVAIGFAAPGGIQLYANLGGMAFTPVADTGLPTTTIAGVEELASGDFNADTFPDLAAAIPFEFPTVWQNWRTGLSPFGNGCQGTLPQAATITTNGPPLRGNAGFAVRVGIGTPSTIGFAWLGTSKRSWSGGPLPLQLATAGAPGCTLLVAPDAVTTALFDAQGNIGIPLPIPANPALLRQTVFAQGAVFAPGSNPLALAFTAGIAIRIE
jgi:FG-GAP-like repeat